MRVDLTTWPYSSTMTFVGVRVMSKADVLRTYGTVVESKDGGCG